MEEAEGVVFHVVLAKFKEGVTAEQIEELIREGASLVNKIEPIKSFHWGTDLGMGNMHQGYTHIFRLTFESAEGVAEFLSHPAHLEFAHIFLAALDQFVAFDYKPTLVRP